MNFLFLSKNFNQIDQVFMPKLLLTKETEFKIKLFQTVIHSNTYIILEKKKQEQFQLLLTGTSQVIWHILNV